MAKGKKLVVGFSLVLLFLFGLLCYLMSFVNPDPLPPPVESTTEHLTIESTTPEQKRRGLNIKLSNEPSRDQTNLFDYGLEKATEEESNAAKSNEFSKLIPLYRHLLRNKGFVNSSLVRDVSPPIVPSMQRISTTNQTPVVFIKNKNSATSQISTYTTNHPSVKGFRRSVSDTETNSLTEEQNTRVIIKIIDDSGRSRIEIRLGPNSSFKDNKLRHYRSSGNKLKAKNSSHAIDFVSQDNDKTSANTVIKILPNNTMVFEETEYSLVSLNVIKEKTLEYNEDNHVKNASSTNANHSYDNDNKTNILLKSGILINSSSDIPLMIDKEIYTLKMRIDNETKSINQLVKNTNTVNKTLDSPILVSSFEEKVNITHSNKTKETFHNEHNSLNDSQTATPDHLFDTKLLKD